MNSFRTAARCIWLRPAVALALTGPRLELEDPVEPTGPLPTTEAQGPTTAASRGDARSATPVPPKSPWKGLVLGVRERRAGGLASVSSGSDGLATERTARGVGAAWRSGEGEGRPASARTVRGLRGRRGVSATICWQISRNLGEIAGKHPEASSRSPIPVA